MCTESVRGITPVIPLTDAMPITYHAPIGVIRTGPLWSATAFCGHGGLQPGMAGLSLRKVSGRMDATIDETVAESVSRMALPRSWIRVLYAKTMHHCPH